MAGMNADFINPFLMSATKIMQEICQTEMKIGKPYVKTTEFENESVAVDFKLVNLCTRDDIVVTQDYGVAAMALSKGAYAIHQSGKWYTNDNIDQMLMQRHITKCAKRASSKKHIKGHKKRSNEDNIHFAESFEKLVLLAQTKKG